MPEPWTNINGQRCTEGDYAECECPACGEIIEEMWDYGTEKRVMKFHCPHCNALLERLEVFTIQLTELAG